MHIPVFLSLKDLTWNLSCIYYIFSLNMIHYRNQSFFNILLFLCFWFFSTEDTLFFQSVKYTVHILLKDKILEILWKISKTSEKVVHSLTFEKGLKSKSTRNRKTCFSHSLPSYIHCLFVVWLYKLQICSRSSSVQYCHFNFNWC